MKMSLAFRHDTGSDVRRIIARVTGAPVHVAVLFEASDAADPFEAHCIEATFRGVRLIRASTCMAKGHWSITPVSASSAQARTAYSWACIQVGTGYDFWGMLAAWWLGTTGGNGATGRFFCSELAAECVMRAGVDLQPERAASYTPRRLYDTVAPWR